MKKIAARIILAFFPAVTLLFHLFFLSGGQKEYYSIALIIIWIILFVWFLFIKNTKVLILKTFKYSAIAFWLAPISVLMNFGYVVIHDSPKHPEALLAFYIAFGLPILIISALGGLFLYIIFSAFKRAYKYYK